MPRYIDADRFKLWLQENYVLYDGDRYFNDIDAQPTADAHEVKHGRWLWVDGVRCSRCNFKLQTTGLPSYCPNCGAKMG